MLSQEAVRPFWRLYYHLIWGTKNREPLIEQTVEPRLYGYIVNKAKELGVHVSAIGGCCDHVHLVVSIPPKLSVAYVVKCLKGSSSHQISEATQRDFAWQRGYGILSLGERQKATAIAYVQNQKEHHARATTNGWLERWAEFDEGPPDNGLTGTLVREEHVGYELAGEIP